MKKILNRIAITWALTLGIPEKSKAQDIINLKSAKIERTIWLNNNETQLNSIIDQKLDEYNLTDNDKLQVKKLLKDEKFKDTYSTLLKKDDLLSLENILSISILISILACIVLFTKTKKEKEYIKQIEFLEKEKNSLQEITEWLEAYVQTALNEWNWDIEKLREIFDLAPFAISLYRDDWFPEIFNKWLEENTWFTRQRLIDYYNEIIEKADENWKKYMGKRWEITTLLYKNTTENKDLDKTLEYLGMLQDAKKNWYSWIPFTLTTEWWERKTILWTTRPLKEIGKNIRFWIPKDQKVEELEELLRIDILTWTYNKRWLDEDFIKLCTNINREQDHKKYTIVMLDLDNFKWVNDNYWHKVWDEVLEWFVNYIHDKIRWNDKLYRIWWDEFIIIMDTDNIDAITNHLNIIRKEFYENNSFYSKWNGIKVWSSWWLKTINISDYIMSEINLSDNFESIKNILKAEMSYNIHNNLIFKEKITQAFLEENKDFISESIREDKAQLFKDKEMSLEEINTFIETELSKWMKEILKNNYVPEMYIDFLKKYIFDNWYKTIWEIFSSSDNVKNLVIEWRFFDIKHEIDEYMYWVKYYKLIKEKLVAEWKIQDSWEEKNGIAEPMFDNEWNFTWVRITNNYWSFELTKEELQEIEDIKKWIKDFRST